SRSGVNRPLDARAAARLCRAYGVSHSLVTIGDRFARGLADYVQEASRLSGGLASLRQAPEVYLYHQLGGSFDARISGNLGNQVGRGGTEGVSTRRAELGILSPALRAASTVGGSAPSGSLIKMRLRDLKHRFFGEPESTSFQRSLLQRLGGFAAAYPINYGWRATGGVSPAGLLWGAATFAGMAVQKWRLDDG